MFPLFTSPRARRRGTVALAVEREGVVLLRTVRDSALGNGGTHDGGGEAGTEKPTMDEAGGKGSEVEAAPVSQDSDVLIKTGGVGAGTGTSVVVGAGAGKDAVDEISMTSGSVHGTTISCCIVPSG